MRGTENFASRLRHRITLQAPENTMQPGGHFALVWRDVATVWAEVKPLENRALNNEALFGEQLQHRGSHEIRLRYLPGVSAEMRVVFNGRYFNIRSVVNPGERNTALVLVADEQAQGFS